MTTTRFFTGVGSRKAPADVQDLTTEIVKRLVAQGWRSRSGEAEGMDQAVSTGDPNCQIFLPWRGFADKGQFKYPDLLWNKAQDIARDPRVYPPFASIEAQIAKLERDGRKASASGKSIGSLRAVLKLQTRNVFQVLGPMLDNPSEFTLCWTPDGATSRADYKPGITGGTGTAINLSDLYKVPVANLKRPEHRRVFEHFVRTGELDLEAIRPTNSNMELCL